MAWRLVSATLAGLGSSELAVKNAESPYEQAQMKGKSPHLRRVRISPRLAST